MDRPMSRVVVIGATGHIGTYLVPRLVGDGHEVIAVSRGARGPYHASPRWSAVTTVTADREAEDAQGTFGMRIAALRPEVVIDLICFTAASALQLVAALRPARPLLVHCGTIWVHGPSLRVPVTEDEPRTAYGAYGTGKAEIEALLHEETKTGGVPAVVLHPGHISGPGWPVITPAGNLDPATWTALATGQPLALPDHGLGVLHHVHADDVAQAFELALSRPAAIGGSFHVTAEQAMTQRGLAVGAAAWFGREAVLDFVDWEEFASIVGPGNAEVTREHTYRSIAASIARAREVLGYAPRYTALGALREALAWLVANGQADIGDQPFPGSGLPTSGRDGTFVGRHSNGRAGSAVRPPRVACRVVRWYVVECRFQHWGRFAWPLIPEVRDDADHPPGRERRARRGRGARRRARGRQRDHVRGRTARLPRPLRLQGVRRAHRRGRGDAGKGRGRPGDRADRQRVPRPAVDVRPGPQLRVRRPRAPREGLDPAQLPQDEPGA
jgi:nucleoside-diphosphate-sugar epimerase